MTRSRLVWVSAYVLLVTSWGLSTWLGLALVGEVYRGELDGSLVSGVLSESDVRPLGYYRRVLLQLVTASHFVGLVALTVAAAWRLRSATFVLAALIVGDAVLIAGSAVFGGFLHVGRDASIPEFVQYGKEAAVAVSCWFVARSRRTSAVLAAFGGLFAWFLIDDALQYHEHVGMLISENIELSRVASALGGVRPQDVGEVLSLALPVAVWAPVTMYAYMRSDHFGRAASRYLAVVVCFLGLFGVGVDLLGHVVALERLDASISHVEDGGEMAIMSIATAYAATLVWQVADARRPIAANVKGTDDP